MQLLPFAYSVSWGEIAGIILLLLYFFYNLGIVGAMLKDAMKTSFVESGCTFWKLVSALFFAAALYIITMLIFWGLPLLFPNRFRVGGERIS